MTWVTQRSTSVIILASGRWRRTSKARKASQDGQIDVVVNVLFEAATLDAENRGYISMYSVDYLR
jgi:hypothetical protein